MESHCHLSRRNLNIWKQSTPEMRILSKTCIPVGCVLPTCWPYGVGLHLEGVCRTLGGSASGGLHPEGSALGGLHPGGSAQPQGVCIGGVGLDRPPSPREQKWHTGVKTLPCPKLRLRAVIKFPSEFCIFLHWLDRCKSHHTASDWANKLVWLNLRCESEREPEVNSSTHDSLTLPSFFTLLSYFAVEERGKFMRLCKVFWSDLMGMISIDAVEFFVNDQQTQKCHVSDNDYFLYHKSQSSIQ